MNKQSEAWVQYLKIQRYCRNYRSFLKKQILNFENFCCWNFVGVEEHQHIQGYSEDFVSLPSSSTDTESGLFTNE